MVFDCPRPSAGVPAPIKSPCCITQSLVPGSLLDTIPETGERRKSGELSRFRCKTKNIFKNLIIKNIVSQNIYCLFSRSGLDLLSGHHSHHSSHSHHKMILTGDRDRAEKPSSFGVKSGVKKLFPLNRSITTIPEDFQTQSQDAEE